MRYRWAVLLAILLLLSAVVAGILLVFLPRTVGPEGWRVSQAFVAGGFIAAGWLAAYALRETGDLMERQQRRGDVQRALTSEIRDYHSQFSQVNPEQQARDMWDLIRGDRLDAPNYYHPLVPLVSAPVVFEAMVTEIHYLPEDRIGQVTRFYSKLSTLRLFAEELRGPLARRMSADRRRHLYWGYMQNLQHATHAGEVALVALGALKTVSATPKQFSSRPDSGQALPQTFRGPLDDQT